MLYFVTAVLAIWSLYLSFKHDFAKNRTLLVLLIAIFAYSVLQQWVNIEWIINNKFFGYSLIYATGYAFENTCHWAITQAYIQTAYQTRQLVNVDIYLSDPDAILRVIRFKRIMTFTNVAVTLLILTISVLLYIGLKANFYADKLYFVANYLSLAFQVFCALAWGWTLYALYRGVKSSKKLLPNKNLFILHGSLLALYFVVEATEIFTWHVASHTSNDQKRTVYWGWSSFLSDLVNFLEMCTFFLVVYIMLPISESRREKLT